MASLFLGLAMLPMTLAGPAPASYPAQASSPYGDFVWPVEGPVLHGYEPPSSPYGSGHRGIDIGAPFGTPVGAAGAGTVSFSGWIGGSLYLSIDHAEGVRTTYSWLSSTNALEGQAVARGEIVALTGHGHPESSAPHLHFGARVDGEYIDPLLLLGGGSVVGLIRLAPLDEAG
jgi:murein DD-endopeptidase MepM/ murein hydrolase activator NlpD